MADVLREEQRRLNMSRIRGRDTKPEMILRRGLHALGLRFRLHSKNLPGKPDLVFPGHRAVILVHGCFWHWHGCPMFTWPATRPEFWREKIAGNRERDLVALERLRQAGWRVLVVWECALRGPGRRKAEDVLDSCEAFVRNGHEAVAELSGDWPAGEGEVGDQTAAFPRGAPQR
jgi:DNA mismatch endonuclease, patch repair protein